MVAPVLHPPVDQCFVVGAVETGREIDLRHHIIDPVFACPPANVGIEVIISLPAKGEGAFRVALLVFPDTKRADAKLHPRLYRPDRIADLPDEFIDVLPPPVVVRQVVGVVLLKCSVVGKGRANCAKGIKIIVEVNPVHVIVSNNVGHCSGHVSPHVGQA